MNLAPLLLFLHITLIFVAITVAYGTTVLARLAFMTGQVVAVRGVGMAAGRVGPIIPVLFIASGIFGLLTAIAFGYDLLAPWLVIAYVLFGVAMIMGFRFNAPWAARLGAILQTTPDGPIEGELRTHFTSTAVITAVDVLIPILLIFDMVVKPFS